MYSGTLFEEGLSDLSLLKGDSTNIFVASNVSEDKTESLDCNDVIKEKLSVAYEFTAEIHLKNQLNELNVMFSGSDISELDVDRWNKGMNKKFFYFLHLREKFWKWKRVILYTSTSFDLFKGTPVFNAIFEFFESK